MHFFLHSQTFVILIDDEFAAKEHYIPFIQQRLHNNSQQAVKDVYWVC